MLDKKHILIFLAYPQRMAGTNLTFLKIANCLRDEFDFTVVFPDKGIAASFFEQKGFNTLICKTPPYLSKYGKSYKKWKVYEKLFRFVPEFLKYQWQLICILRKIKYDIAHFGEVRSFILYFFINKILRKRTILQIPAPILAPKLVERLCYYYSDYFSLL